MIKVNEIKNFPPSIKNNLFYDILMNHIDYLTLNGASAEQELLLSVNGFNELIEFAHHFDEITTKYHNQYPKLYFNVLKNELLLNEFIFKIKVNQ